MESAVEHGFQTVVGRVTKKRLDSEPLYSDIADADLVDDIMAEAVTRGHRVYPVQKMPPYVYTPRVSCKEEKNQKVKVQSVIWGGKVLTAWRCCSWSWEVLYGRVFGMLEFLFWGTGVWGFHSLFLYLSWAALGRARGFAVDVFTLFFFLRFI